MGFWKRVKLRLLSPWTAPGLKGRLCSHVKNIRYPVAAAVLAFLLFSVHPTRGDSPSIISEWNATIQIIPAEDFSDWPGVESAVPVDVSAEAGRIWILWPDAIVSLDSEGYPDTLSLLSLFSSSTGKWPGDSWSPEGGLMCSDGIWRSVDLPNRVLLELDPVTGVVTQRPWEENRPTVLHPAGGGNLLAVSGNEVSLVFTGAADPPEAQHRIIDSELPPLSLAAASRKIPVMAWKAIGSPMIQIAPIPLEEETNLPTSEIPVRQEIRTTGNPWGMDWSGSMLILAGPGRLTAVIFGADGSRETRVLEDPRLPGRWYRIRGGEDRLLVHSPETGLIASIQPGTGPKENPSTDFSFLLEAEVLNAGDLLENRGLDKEAAAYYSWALSLVRRERSRYPLAESWPMLEKEIADRRAILEGIY